MARGRTNSPEVVGGKPQTMREVLHQCLGERVLLSEVEGLIRQEKSKQQLKPEGQKKQAALHFGCPNLQT